MNTLLWRLQRPQHSHPPASAVSDASLVRTLPLGALIVAAAMVSALAFPLALMLRSYMELADVLLSGHQLADCFLPVGYAAVVALGTWLDASHGLALIQAGFYLATMALVWSLISERLEGVGARTLALVFGLVAFHPHMLINIHRVNDNAINLFMMLVLWAWVARQRARAAFGFWPSVLTGCAFAYLLLARPNSASLAPVLLWAVLQGHEAWSLRVRAAITFLGASAATYALLAWLITGSATFWPANGPYNLYAGNNPYSNAVMLERGNGEESLDLALQAKGLLAPGQPAYEVSPALMKQLAYEHIQAHPLESLKGVLIKAWVLLGPDLRQAQTLPKAFVQYLLACPFVVWVLLLMRSAVVLGRHADWLPAAFIALYALPFLLFNADARLRSPLLDVMFMLHGASLYRDMRLARHRA